MKKFLKKTEGFTLVELIVVIAILGILAAIAVPAYSGYITKANESADITQLDAILTASQAAMAETGAVTSIEVTTSTADTNKGQITDIKVNGSVMLVASSGTEASQATDFDLYYGSTTMPTLKSDEYKGGATWSTTHATYPNEWIKK